MLLRIRTLILFSFLPLFGANFIDFEKWEIVISQESATDALITPTDLSLLAKEMLKDCFYNSNWTVRDFLMANPKIERRFNFLSLTPSSQERVHLSDGTSFVDFRIPIRGALYSLLAPKTGGGLPLSPIACPLCGQPWPEGKEIPEGIVPIPIESEETPKYTGVIIDARRLDLKPSLFPQVLDEEGREVYGPSFVDRDELIQQGMVQYLNSLSAAYASDRAGNSPALITPLRVSGKNRCDIVISSSDAKRLHSSSQTLKALRRCRVIIVRSEEH
jgi:hypothetical protein|uniref:Uncharacterized protein n=1 Tax=candidate division WOR-3 bacterium TaxID=2052148 RepID=A0A7C3Z2H3_UNCW3